MESGGSGYKLQREQLRPTDAEDSDVHTSAQPFMRRIHFSARMAVVLVMAVACVTILSVIMFKSTGERLHGKTSDTVQFSGGYYLAVLMPDESTFHPYITGDTELVDFKANVYEHCLDEDYQCPDPNNLAFCKPEQQKPSYQDEHFNTDKISRMWDSGTTLVMYDRSSQKFV